MKITLSNKFFTELLQLDSQSQTLVLSTCKQLTESDEDAILQYELPADAPDMLAELVGSLKKRVTNSRRRRERRAANPVQANKTANKLPIAGDAPVDKRVSAEAVMEMYELAFNVVVSAGNLLNRTDRARIRQLAKAMMKRMDNIAATAPTPHGHSRRRA